MDLDIYAMRRFMNEFTEEGHKKGDARRRKAKYMFHQAIKFLDIHLQHGGELAWEWPRWNAAWKWPTVIEFWSALEEIDKLRGILVDGCQFGVERKGQPIKKPWRIRVTDPRHLGAARQCPGDHAHAPCLGEGVREKTGRHTPAFCRTLQNYIANVDIQVQV